ncbi:MAG: NAD-dependent epimerase/dehydratase family protein [Planctomycetes bacterium]|nr:NAD-dependent epimerase/dehydratase family protein [Planctomycetota bacterium]
MSQGCAMQSGLTGGELPHQIFPPVTMPETRKLFEQTWTRFFGSLTSNKLAARVFVDFVAANIVLVMAAIVRLALIGGLSWANPVGTLFDKVNATYLMNAGWFGLSSVVLFALSGVYKPVPFSRFKQRLNAIVLASVVGLVAHQILGTFAFDKAQQTFEVGLPAWALLCAVMATVRYSRMKVGEHFRVVPRGEAANTKVEDVLVVGGAGYIGSILARQLLDAGYRVRVLDLELFGTKSLADVLDHPRLEVMNGDFRNIGDAVRALRGMDAVCHLAAIVGDPACALDRDTTIAVNYAAAKMMAQLAKANGVTKFVFASTCSVYGDSEDIMSEDSPLNPVSLYATTKIDAERALLDTADSDFQPTILRFATAYGWSHRPRFDLVANLFSAQAVTDKKIRVFNGEQWRPFVHTRDIARACVLTLEAPLAKVGGQIFNVGDESQNYTLTQLGQIVARSCPGIEVEEVRNGDDARNYRVNFSKIRRTLGFRASVDLVEGVQEMVDAICGGHVSNWRDPIYSNSKHLEGEGLSVLKFDALRKTVDEMPATTRFLTKKAAA